MRDVVLEGVPEALGQERDIFGELDEFAPTSALLASNTQTISVIQIAEYTNRPARGLGLHLFNPPVMMRLVETDA